MEACFTFQSGRGGGAVVIQMGASFLSRECAPWGGGSRKNRRMGARRPSLPPLWGTLKFEVIRSA